LNKWYHFIFQRDATLRVVTLAIHDEEGNLVDFEFRQSHEAYDLPVSSSLPLFLGRQSPDGSGFFHGYLDEIRISNSLRYFDLPPVILYKHYLSNVESSEKIGNQYDDVSEYEVDLNIAVLGSHNGVKDAKIFYRLVDDPYEKVLMDDPSWNEVSMTQIEGDNFKGAIPKQPLGTIIDYYTTATSITGKTTVFGAYPDTMYDRFGVMRRNDVVLKLSFEEEDMNFVDSSVYNNQLVKFGNWVLWDDPDDVPEGEYCVYLTEGSFGMGEIKSPFLSLERYTVTLWVEPDTLAHNVYIISNTPRGNWWEDNYTILHRYKQIKNDAYHDNRWPGEFPWQGDMAYVSAGENGKWSHYLINCGPESLVVQRNDENDNPIERLVWTNNGKGWTKGFIPRVPSNGKFRIGPPTTPGPGTPFYEGKLDELVVYNYQTLPGNFKKSPPTSIHHDLVNPPKKYKLYQNYPNPFNPQTTIKFEIPKNTLVTLKIYDLRGRLIKTLYKNEKAEAGIYKILWDGTNEYGKLVSSGVYIYQLKTKDFIKSNKMILIK